MGIWHWNMLELHYQEHHAVSHQQHAANMYFTPGNNMSYCSTAMDYRLNLGRVSQQRLANIQLFLIASSYICTIKQYHASFYLTSVTMRIQQTACCSIVASFRFRRFLTHFHGSPKSLQANAVIVPYNRPFPLHVTSFPSHSQKSS